MNGNFEFEKLMANERLQAALREADEHLRIQHWRRRSLVRMILTQLLLGGAGLFLIVLLLSGCMPVSPAILSEGDAVKSLHEGGFALPFSLDDLIRHDTPQREPATGARAPAQSVHPWPMAERIRLHDRLLKVERLAVEPQSPWTMADRIRFHDRLQDRR